jgi:hypothetical protein
MVFASSNSASGDGELAIDGSVCIKDEDISPRKKRRIIKRVLNLYLEIGITMVLLTDIDSTSI